MGGVQRRVWELEKQAYVRRAVTVLTNAQIKALPTTAVQVLPEPGPDGLLNLISAVVHFKRTADYTNISNGGYLGFAMGLTVDQFITQQIQEKHPSTPGVSQLLAGEVDTVAWFTPLIRDIGNAFGAVIPEVASLAVGAPAVIFAINGDGNYTGGHEANTLTVTAYYTVVGVS